MSESSYPSLGASPLPHRNAVYQLQAPVGRCDRAPCVSVLFSFSWFKQLDKVLLVILLFSYGYNSLI